MLRWVDCADDENSHIGEYRQEKYTLGFSKYELSTLRFLKRLARNKLRSATPGWKHGVKTTFPQYATK